MCLFFGNLVIILRNANKQNIIGLNLAAMCLVINTAKFRLNLISNNVLNFLLHSCDINFDDKLKETIKINNKNRLVQINFFFFYLIFLIIYILMFIIVKKKNGNGELLVIKQKINKKVEIFLV